MKPFTYYQPTEIRFGSGRVKEVADAVGRYGKHCLMVTVDKHGPLSGLFDCVRQYLEQGGSAVEHFDGVVPNPTTGCVTAGANLAKAFGADVVLGIGGGSSMDTAKAIAVEASHPGTAWDYLFFKTPPTEKTLPVVTISTTSGTGSQVTQVAVITDTETKTKSAIYNSLIYPRIGIVDPELMISMPPHVTVTTGFDAFTHAFESYIHVGGQPYTDVLAVEAIRLVAQWLPVALAEPHNLEAREAMAWADTLAGLCIANAGVTLPHGIGMTIGGQCPQVAHGEALAVIYPEFTRFTYASAVEKFAVMGRIFDPSLEGKPDAVAAEKSCEALDRFLKQINLWLSLGKLGVSQADVVAIADNSRVLPDYKNNPRIASRDEIYAMLMASYSRV